jgi:hypothetical protein
MKWYEYIIIGIAMMGAVHLGLLLRADAQANHKPELLPEHVIQEAVLVGSMQKGKVNTYRVVDTELHIVCYVTVGELHGKTVAQDCFSLRSLGTMWIDDENIQ